jgi:DNA-binding LacI/PurR family transcriptional regulator
VVIFSEITQKDIAKVCKVSRETVTKALQDHPKIARETKARIQAMAEKMGYIPNYYARNLASKKNKTIGIIVPKISHSFHSSVVELIYKYAENHGYNVLPMISFEERRNEIRNIETLMSMRVDGIIANISQETSDNKYFHQLKQRGVPLVFFDRMIESDMISHVATEDRKATCEIVSYGLSKGYSKPAHLAGYSNINIGRERRNGFLDALNKFNIKPNPDWIIEGGFSEELRYENARRLLSLKNRPDLVFCFNDSIAHSVYNAAEESGINIPGELGVIGYGNLALARLIRPKLSTVDLPVDDIARETVRLLLRQIDSPARNNVEHVVLKPDVIIRESCR